MEALISHKSNAPREMRKTTDTVFDRIWKSYFNKKTNVALNKEEEAIRERWDFAWKMLANMYTRRQVIEAITQKFNVKKSIAYDDISKTMMLFGDPRNSNKEAKRALTEEWIIKGIKKAWDDGDLDAYERLVGRFAKINQLENDDQSESLEKLLKNLAPTQIIINSNVPDLEAEAKRLQDELTHDIEHSLVDE